ncbi:MAG: SH3 domain-containing protein, partial [Planctomycetia bacterium]|nr:SH3 domain-containing protein [Planctomycetia bacterium]
MRSRRHSSRPWARGARRAALAWWGSLVAVAVVLGGGAPSVRADEPSSPSAPALDPAWSVGVIRGDSVNLRVGPRQDDQAVQTLDQGTVVVIVERAGDWLGVRLPAGFSGAVAADLTEPVDTEHVRVTGQGVNLRRGPGLDQPPFRDRLERGTVLPILAKEGDWYLVEAPEEIRAYVFSAYVEEKGTVEANAERIEEGRKRRVAREALRAQTTKKVAAEGDEKGLRDELALVGKALTDLRAAGGYDVGPVAALEDRLAEVVKARAGASDRTKALANVVLEDLRREQAIRVAFADEILAKKRLGQAPPASAKAPAEVVDVDAAGTLRWEAAPGWDGGGAFVLWTAAEKPSHALKWAKGDLKAF